MENKTIEKIHELQKLCLQIQMHGEGENGHPYVSYCSSNYGSGLEVYIEDDGFNPEKPYDGNYHLTKWNVDTDTYKACREHLLRLKEKIYRESDHENPEHKPETDA